MKVWMKLLAMYVASSLAYSNVKEEQKLISSIGRNDVLAVLPTGFGKMLLLRLHTGSNGCCFTKTPTTSASIIVIYGGPKGRAMR